MLTYLSFETKMLIEEQFQLRKCSEVKDQTKPEKRMFMEYWTCWSAVRNVQERRWVVRRFRHVARFWEVVWRSLHVPGNFMPAETLGKPSLLERPAFAERYLGIQSEVTAWVLHVSPRKHSKKNIVWLKTLHLKHSRKLNDKVQPQISKAPWIFIMCRLDSVVLKFQNSRCIQTYCGTLTLCVSHAASKEVMEEEWLFGDYGDDESS